MLYLRATIIAVVIFVLALLTGTGIAVLTGFDLVSESGILINKITQLVIGIFAAYGAAKIYYRNPITTPNAHNGLKLGIFMIGIWFLIDIILLNISKNLTSSQDNPWTYYLSIFFWMTLLVELSIFIAVSNKIKNDTYLPDSLADIFDPMAELKTDSLLDDDEDVD